MDEIRTERLLLRRPRPSDLAALHAVLSDARAMRYWATAPHATIAESERWLAGMIAASSEGSADFVIELDGCVIGKVGMWRPPEIGFILRPDSWGRGFAAEALKAAIGQAFARFDIPAVIADVDPRNAASLRLLARFGFRETGRAERTYEIDGQWCDSIYLTLDRDAWQEREG